MLPRIRPSGPGLRAAARPTLRVGALVAALLYAPWASAQSAGCGPRALARTATTGTNTAGIEVYTDRSAANPIELRLLRLPPERWTVRVRDMRDLRQAKSRLGDYTSPRFSLAELESMAPPRRILASAGMTESLYAPVPVGLLKVGGVLRSKANPSSRNLDGVFCVRADRRITILSEASTAGRRIPQDIQTAFSACAEAVQAGPMLVDQGAALVASRGPLSVPRVFAAIDRERRLVLGYSPNATTFDLACTLADDGLRIHSAIHLQSDALGGVLFGRTSGITEKPWGRVDATVASALEIEPR